MLKFVSLVKKETPLLGSNRSYSSRSPSLELHEDNEEWKNELKKSIWRKQLLESQLAADSSEKLPGASEKAGRRARTTSMSGSLTSAANPTVTKEALSRDRNGSTDLSVTEADDEPGSFRFDISSGYRVGSERVQKPGSAAAPTPAPGASSGSAYVASGYGGSGFSGPPTRRWISSSGDTPSDATSLLARLAGELAKKEEELADANRRCSVLEEASKLSERDEDGSGVLTELIKVRGSLATLVRVVAEKESAAEMFRKRAAAAEAAMETLQAEKEKVVKELMEATAASSVELSDLRSAEVALRAELAKKTEQLHELTDKGRAAEHAMNGVVEGKAQAEKDGRGMEGMLQKLKKEKSELEEALKAARAAGCKKCKESSERLREEKELRCKVQREAEGTKAALEKEMKLLREQLREKEKKRLESEKGAQRLSAEIEKLKKKVDEAEGHRKAALDSEAARAREVKDLKATAAEATAELQKAQRAEASSRTESQKLRERLESEAAKYRTKEGKWSSEVEDLKEKIAEKDKVEREKGAQLRTLKEELVGRLKAEEESKAQVAASGLHVQKVEEELLVRVEELAAKNKVEQEKDAQLGKLKEEISARMEELAAKERELETLRETAGKAGASADAIEQLRGSLVEREAEVLGYKGRLKEVEDILFSLGYEKEATLEEVTSPRASAGGGASEDGSKGKGSTGVAAASSASNASGADKAGRWVMKHCISVESLKKEQELERKLARRQVLNLQLEVEQLKQALEDKEREGRKGGDAGLPAVKKENVEESKGPSEEGKGDAGVLPSQNPWKQGLYSNSRSGSFSASLGRTTGARNGGGGLVKAATLSLQQKGQRLPDGGKPNS